MNTNPQTQMKMVQCGKCNPLSQLQQFAEMEVTFFLLFFAVRDTCKKIRQIESVQFSLTHNGQVGGTITGNIDDLKQ